MVRDGLAVEIISGEATLGTNSIPKCVVQCGDAQ